MEWQPLSGASSAHSLTKGEYVQILAKRVLYSRAYTCFYLSMIGAGVIEVCWILAPSAGGGFGQLPTHPAFTAVETYVTIGLVCELTMRAILSGPAAFCSLPANVFDTVVAAVSVASSLLIAAGMETPAELLVAEILVTGRVLFRLSRLLAITKSFQRQQQAAYRKLEINLLDDCPEFSPATSPSAADGLEASHSDAHMLTPPAGTTGGAGWDGTHRHQGDGGNGMRHQARTTLLPV